MTGPFGEDELFEDEWVEICDIEGRRASVRHLATIRMGDQTYMLLGDSFEEAGERGALMLVREEKTVDGALQYVMSNDEQEIERVVGQFAMHLLMDYLPEEFEGMEPVAQDMTEPCGRAHRPGEFCYCDDPAYLQ